MGAFVRRDRRAAGSDDSMRADHLRTRASADRRRSLVRPASSAANRRERRPRELPAGGDRAAAALPPRDGPDQALAAALLDAVGALRRLGPSASGLRRHAEARLVP